MANELTLNATLAYADSESAGLTLGVLSLLATVAAKKFVHAKQSVGITEEAVGLGEVTAPGWAVFVNRDITHFVTLKVAASGAVFAKLLPGEFALLRLGAGAQAPYAVADTAACQLEYVVVST